ncbi:Putative ribonuclease H protein At1g65750 [Linum perenne]
MSILKAPILVVKKLEQLQNRVMWAGNLDANRTHWVQWKMVKTDMSLRGLGIQDLKALNLALMSKWMWRYAVEHNSSWRHLIVIKCGRGVSDWLPVWSFGSANTSMWRWVVLKSPTFYKFGYIDLGGGGLCAFWLDFWVASQSLGKAYPRIVVASQSLDSCISNVRVFLDDQWS